MWICKNDAFLSIVNKGDVVKDGERCLCVRARLREHLEAAFPGEEIIETPRNDYQFRAFVPAKAVAAALSESILDIDYDNFKNSVDDHGLHDAYSDIWGTMYRMAMEARRAKFSNTRRRAR